MKVDNEKICNEYNFILCNDKLDQDNNKISNFEGYNTLDELEKNICLSPCSNYYQYIRKNKKVKLFFDIDFKKGDYISREQTNIMIELIIQEINNSFNVESNIEDYIIQTNNNYYNISSIHIICKIFHTDKKELKELKNILYDKYEIVIDDIYTEGRQFRLCNNVKINKDENKYTLINYNDKYFDLSNEWIENLDNTEYIKLDKVNNNNLEVIKEEQKIYIIESLNIDLYLHIKTQLKRSFFLTHNDWKNLSYFIFNKFEFVDKENIIKDWLLFSANQSNKYTEEQNIFYYNNEGNKKKNLTLGTLIYILNKYTDIKYKTKTDYNPIIEQIYNITKIDKEIINNKLKENIDKKGRYKIIDDNIKLDSKTNILYTEKEIYNLNEKTYNKILNSNNLKYNKIKIDNVEEVNKNFIDDKFDILLCRAKCGSGKTRYIVKPIIEKLHNKKILFITENNTNNKEVLEDLQKLGFVNHIDRPKFTTKHNKIICSYESLNNKVGEREFDILILDEIETIFSHIESSTMYNNYNGLLNNASKILKWYISNIKKIICLDADLSYNRIEKLIYSIRPQTITKYYNIFLDNDNYENYKYYFYLNSHNKIIESMFEDINNNSNFVLSSTTQYRAENYFNMFQNYIQDNQFNINICLIDGKGAKKNNMNEYSKELKEEAIKNITKFLEDNNIDIFIYTPTFKTGANIRKVYNKHYSIGCNNSVNIRIYNQMIYRTRILKSKEYHIYIEKSNPKLYNYITLEEAKQYIKNINNSRYTEHNIINITEDDKTKFLLDDYYHNQRAINYTENYNSKKSFLSLLLYTLKYTHNCNIIYIDGKEQTYKTQLYLDACQTANDEENIKLCNIPLINKKEFERIKETPNKDKYDYEKMKKYKLLQLYNIPVIRMKTYSNFKHKKIQLFRSNIFSCNTCLNPVYKNYIDDFETKHKIIDEYNDSINNKLQLHYYNQYENKIVKVDKIENYYYTYFIEYSKIKNFIDNVEEKFIDVFEYIINKKIVDKSFYENNNNYFSDGNDYINKNTLQYIKIANIKYIIKEYYELYYYSEYLKNCIELDNEYNKINIPSFYDLIKKREYTSKFYNLLYVNNILQFTNNTKYNNIVEYEAEEEEKEIATEKGEQMIRIKYTKKIIDIMKIDISNNTIINKYIITNYELFEIYKNIIDDIIEIEKEIYIKYPKLYKTNNKIFESNKILDDEKYNKKKITNITNKLNMFLNYINLSIKYLHNKHTTRHTDKLKIESKYNINTNNNNIVDDIHQYTKINKNKLEDIINNNNNNNIIQLDENTTYDKKENKIIHYFCNRHTEKNNIYDKQNNIILNNANRYTIKRFDNFKLYNIPKINYVNNKTEEEIKDTKNNIYIHNKQVYFTEDKERKNKLNKYTTTKYIIDKDKNIKVNLNTNNDYIYIDFQFEYKKDIDEKKTEDKYKRDLKKDPNIQKTNIYKTNTIYRNYEYNKQIENKIKKLVNKNTSFDDLKNILNNNIDSMNNNLYPNIYNKYFDCNNKFEENIKSINNYIEVY
jgi:hypothetical protein